MNGATIRSRFPVRRRLEVAEKRAAVGEAKAPSRVARMLALAHHVERLVEAGELQSVAAASRALGLTRARLTQVMQLLLLATEIQERILTAELSTSERSLRCVVREPTWDTQLETGRCLRAATEVAPVAWPCVDAVCAV